MTKKFYPAQFDQELFGFCVSFRDFPEANTCGDDFLDAVFMAKDSLSVASEFYTEAGRTIPHPSMPQNGDVMIEFDPS